MPRKRAMPAERLAVLVEELLDASLADARTRLNHYRALADGHARIETLIVDAERRISERMDRALAGKGPAVPTPAPGVADEHGGLSVAGGELHVKLKTLAGWIGKAIVWLTPLVVGAYEAYRAKLGG